MKSEFWSYPLSLLIYLSSLSDKRSCWYIFSFKQMCVDAYLLLRKKGNLLISLFMMMLSTGLPELKTVDDLKYLQVSIHVCMCVCVDVNLLSCHFKSSFNDQKLTSSQQSYFASYGVRGYITLICFAYLSLHYLEPGSKLRIGIVGIYQSNTFWFFGVVPSINRNQIATAIIHLVFPIMYNGAYYLFFC